MEGKGRSWEVFSNHWIDISREKRYQWVVVGGGWVVACGIILSAPVPFLWTLDFGLGFWTLILVFDMGLGFGTGLGLDKKSYVHLTWILGISLT